MPVPVIVLDDHPLMRGTIVATLTAAMPEATVAYAGALLTEAVEAAQREAVACAVVDLDLGDGRSPAEVTAVLAGAGVPSVIVSAHDQPALVQAALRAGARAYVPKRALDAELASAVRAVAEGRPYRSQDFAAVLVPSGGSSAHLTADQERVLVLHAAGLPAAAIAARIGTTADDAEALLDAAWVAFGL